MAENMGERDAALLLDMLLSARDARDFLLGLTEAGFMASRLHQSAVVRALEVIGEAAGKVSPGFRATQNHIAWRQIIGMRHRLVHGYAEIRFDLVWTVARESIPELISSLEKLVPKDDLN